MSLCQPECQYSIPAVNFPPRLLISFRHSNEFVKVKIKILSKRLYIRHLRRISVLAIEFGARVELKTLKRHSQYESC